MVEAEVFHMLVGRLGNVEDTLVQAGICWGLDDVQQSALEAAGFVRL